MASQPVSQHASPSLAPGPREPGSCCSSSAASDHTPRPAPFTSSNTTLCGLLQSIYTGCFFQLCSRLCRACLQIDPLWFLKVCELKGKLSTPHTCPQYHRGPPAHSDGAQWQALSIHRSGDVLLGGQSEDALRLVGPCFCSGRKVLVCCSQSACSALCPRLLWSCLRRALGRLTSWERHHLPSLPPSGAGFPLSGSFGIQFP